MTLRLLSEYQLELLSFKGGCTGASESTLVKMSNCWKSHVTAQLCRVITSLSVGAYTKPWLCDVVFCVFGRKVYLWSSVSFHCLVCDIGYRIVAIKKPSFALSYMQRTMVVEHLRYLSSLIRLFDVCINKAWVLCGTLSAHK